MNTLQKFRLQTTSSRHNIVIIMNFILQRCYVQNLVMARLLISSFTPTCILHSHPEGRINDECVLKRMMRILGPKREEITSLWGKLHKEELKKLCLINF